MDAIETLVAREGYDREVLRELRKTISKRGGSIAQFVSNVCAMDHDVSEFRDDSYNRTDFRPRNMEVYAEFIHMLDDLKLSKMETWSEQEWSEWHCESYRSWCIAQHEQIETGSKANGHEILPPQTFDKTFMFYDIPRPLHDAVWILTT